MVSRRAENRKALKSRTINGYGDSGLSLRDIGARTSYPGRVGDRAQAGNVGVDHDLSRRPKPGPGTISIRTPR
jgi:hypothetical protein